MDKRLVSEKLDGLILLTLFIFSISCCVSEALVRNCTRIVIGLTLVKCILYPVTLCKLSQYKQLFIGIVVFYVLYFISALYGGHIVELMSDNSFVMQYHFLLPVVCLLSVRTVKQVQTLMMGMFISLLISDVYIVEQVIDGVYRPVPLVMKGIIVGTMLYMILIPAMLAMLFDKYLDKKLKTGICICLLISLICVLCTHTRGGWIALFPVLSLQLMYLIKGWKKKVAVVLSYCILLGIVINFVPSIKARVDTIVHSEKEVSVSERYLMWGSAYNMGMDNFIFGVGKGNYADKYQKEYISPLAKEPDQRHAHNNFLQLFAEGGILGIGAYCFMLAVFFVWGWKQRKNIYGVIFLASTSALVLYSLTDHTLVVYSAMRVYWFLLGLCIAHVFIVNNEVNKS